MDPEPMSVEQVIESVGEEVVMIDRGATYSAFDTAAERLGASVLWEKGRLPTEGNIYKIINYIIDKEFHVACLVLIGNSKGEFVIGVEGLSLVKVSKVRSIW